MYHFFYPRLLRAQINWLGTSPNRPCFMPEWLCCKETFLLYIACASTCTLASRPAATLVMESYSAAIPACNGLTKGACHGETDKLTSPQLPGPMSGPRLPSAQEDHRCRLCSDCFAAAAAALCVFMHSVRTFRAFRERVACVLVLHAQQTSPCRAGGAASAAANAECIVIWSP